MSLPRIGLVLSGGGARGAYEAGVIRYLREELPPEVRQKVRFDVLVGTSVGAVTACFLAATADEPEGQGSALAKLWSELSLETVYKVKDQDALSLALKMWRAATKTPVRPEGWRLYDILHPEPLEELVRNRAPWPRITQNLAQGHLQALAVSATQIASGTNVVFVQRREGGVPPWSRDPYTQAREAIIGPEHAMASAAIPLMFRSVKIGEEFFCDGSLRQNTPLSPALRLGAERVLIVSLRHAGRPKVVPLTQYPSTPLLLGKVLNALMLDPTDHDLDRLRRFNGLLEAGQAAFGDQFVPRINEVVQKARGQPYRMVRDLVLRPSRDIAQIAAVHAKKDRGTGAALPTRLLHRIAQSDWVHGADLASYLLFDAGYANELISLAMEDTHARRDALISFFSES